MSVRHLVYRLVICSHVAIFLRWVSVRAFFLPTALRHCWLCTNFVIKHQRFHSRALSCASIDTGGKTLRLEVDYVLHFSTFYTACAKGLGTDRSPVPRCVSFSNNYHKNSMSERAVRFNDQSIQENHHASTLFLALQSDPSINIFKTGKLGFKQFIQASTPRAVLDMSQA